MEHDGFLQWTLSSTETPKKIIGRELALEF